MQNRQVTTASAVEKSCLDPYDALCARRRDALRAFRTWAESHPSPADLADELEGTIGALRGIAATVSASPAQGPAR